MSTALTKSMPTASNAGANFEGLSVDEIKKKVKGGTTKTIMEGLFYDKFADFKLSDSDPTVKSGIALSGELGQLLNNYVTTDVARIKISKEFIESVKEKLTSTGTVATRHSLASLNEKIAPISQQAEDLEIESDKLKTTLNDLCQRFDKTTTELLKNPNEEIATNFKKIKGEIATLKIEIAELHTKQHKLADEYSLTENIAITHLPETAQAIFSSRLQETRVRPEG